MRDLIRRSDAIEVAYQLRHKPNDDEWNDEWLRSLNDIPTIDAVSVVRCEECKHYYDGHWCDEYDYITRSADDFCSYGERSE